ncbi:MAG: hypothetical protein NXI04_17130 [Planctomycetaceae bacterium]|nr:hypothetical protein [Planctomycetaceae bacterium]
MTAVDYDAELSLKVEDLKMLTEIPTLDNLLISGFEEQLKLAGDDPLPHLRPPSEITRNGYVCEVQVPDSQTGCWGMAKT